MPNLPLANSGYPTTLYRCSFEISINFSIRLFIFLFFYLPAFQFRGNIRHHERRDLMEKESALYQLVGVRMNGVMSSITNSDGEYQEIIRRSDIYSDRLEEPELPEEVRPLIDRYVSEQNAHSACVIDLDMRCLFTCLDFPTVIEMLLEKCLFAEPQHIS